MTALSMFLHQILPIEEEGARRRQWATFMDEEDQIQPYALSSISLAMQLLMSHDKTKWPSTAMVASRNHRGQLCVQRVLSGKCQLWGKGTRGERQCRQWRARHNTRQRRAATSRSHTVSLRSVQRAVPPGCRKHVNAVVRCTDC